MSLSGGALLGTLLCLVLFLNHMNQSVLAIEGETRAKHAELRKIEHVTNYIKSVNHIYRIITAASPFLPNTRAWHLAPMFKHISDDSGIPVKSCLLIAKVESDFRRIRAGNDFGIMQINLFWLHRYNVAPKEAMDDWTNLQLFTKIMKELENRPLSYYHSFTPSVRSRYEKRLEKAEALLM